ncbi:hypothetical protein D3C74_458620 [compost metagenome]
MGTGDLEIKIPHAASQVQLLAEHRNGDAGLEQGDPLDQARQRAAIPIEDLEAVAAHGHGVLDLDHRFLRPVEDCQLPRASEHPPQRTAPGLNMGNLHAVGV